MPAKKTDNLQIPELKLRMFELTLVGDTELIVHKFSNKHKQMIEDKQQQKAKHKKEARDPEQEFRDALYVMPKKRGEKKERYGFPAPGFKKACVSACRYVDGVTMTYMLGAFHVLADAGGLVEIKGDEPYMREDTVKIGTVGGTLDLRYRPAFPNWQVTLKIKYNASVITPEQIVNAFNVAGFAVGVGDYRPERKGSNGMFHVVSTKATADSKVA